MKELDKSSTKDGKSQNKDKDKIWCPDGVIISTLEAAKHLAGRNIGAKPMLITVSRS